MTRLLTPLFIFSVVVFFLPRQIVAYPLDGFDEASVQRLEGYYYSLNTDSGKQLFDPGQLLTLREVSLKAEKAPPQLPANDPQLTKMLSAILAPHQSAYSLSVLDISNPLKPVYAGINDQRRFIPASVGKVLVALAVLSELDRLYPDSIEARAELMRSKIIVANEYIETDHHEVPFWLKEEGFVRGRQLEIGDRANLITYLDWMLSASSNAAAGMLMRELVLMRNFGERYPVTPAEEEAFLAGSSAATRSQLLAQVVKEALQKSGLDRSKLWQSSLFTRAGRKAIPNGYSTASAREFMKLLYFMERGELIDPESSLELKRLLYHTQKRIRYAEAPELDGDAVYYKSGSMYKCRPEAGFACRKYHGNVLNLLNTIAIVESPAVNPKNVYLVALSSNLLRKDSSTLHAELAAKIKTTIEQFNLDRGRSYQTQQLGLQATRIPQDRS